MILNEKLLFIHVPKTGGMALTSLLLDVLPGIKYYTLPEPDSSLEGRASEIRHLVGTRHETLAEARSLLLRHGLDLSSFAVILAGARNPYALEVSRYAYLQQGHEVDRGPEQDLAMSNTFEKYLALAPYDPSKSIENYYCIDGEMPENLRIIRLEHLDEDVSRVLAEIGLPGDRHIPSDNESVHDDFRSYYTSNAERIVRERYRWFFQQGWYEPLEVAESPESATSSRTPGLAHKLPVHGCLEQVGPTSGAYSDGWIGEELRVRVRGAGGADYLTLEAFVPEGPAQQLSLQIGRERFTSRFPTGEVHWTVPCYVPATSPTLVILSSAGTWVPAERVDGSPDTRRLSIVVSRITFSRSGERELPPSPVEDDDFVDVSEVLADSVASSSV